MILFHEVIIFQIGMLYKPTDSSEHTSSILNLLECFSKLSYMVQLVSTARTIRPVEGWLSFGLLLGVVLCVSMAVVEVNWVPEDVSLVFLAVCGMVMGSVLAKREVGVYPAGTLITLYALITTTSTVGQLLPSPQQIISGTATPHIRQQTALLLDRIASWLHAISNGGQSQETIVFALGIGLLAWSLCAYAGWATYRQHRPLAGLTLLGLALALNGYFANEDSAFWAMAVFIGLSALLTATMHFAHFERTWLQEGIDYSDEIRLELLAVAGVAAMCLLMVAYVMPTVRFSELSRSFQNLAVVQKAEDTLERVFAGVRSPERPVAAGGVGGVGVLPRAFLLGNAPELEETVVMTATVSLDVQGVAHWRAISYDVYTGRGWARSEEREEMIPAGQPIPLPAINNSLTLSQTVHWQFDNRLVRYTLGQPLNFAHNVTTHWRGTDDLIRVWGDTNDYQATSRLPLASSATLRQTTVEAVPPLVLARYTDLPDDLPQRLHTLAQEIVAPYNNPYDQAKAIEQFVRQYPYSLDVAPPAGTTDPVEYFLFELQSGYCDYYASAMVVLARSVGLPARFATGYQPQPPDENGVQTIRQINAHSWAEVYFAGYGWVEFEPTAGFSEGVVLNTLANSSAALLPDAQLEEPPANVPIPEVTARAVWWGWWVLPPAGLLILLALWWQQRTQSPNNITTAYARLNKAAHWLGYQPPANHTPHEFEQAFLVRLQRWRNDKGFEMIRPGIRTLTRLFITHQYAPTPSPPASHTTAKTTWQKLRLHLLFWRFQRKRLENRD